MSLSALWYQRSGVARWFLYLLWPLSWLYQTLAQQRRAAYLSGRKTRYSAPVPVIIVGNISVGGSGKTPLVIHLALLLKAQGYTPGVISRGYKAQDVSRPRLVAADTTAPEVGDEPLLISRRSKVPVCVFAKRQAAIEALLAAQPVDIVLCDDGLQHYALERDIEIAVIDSERLHGNGLCLPAGPLRESVSRLDSVDFVVYNGQHDTDYFYTSDCTELISVVGIEHRAIDEWYGKTVHAVAGIGFPPRFFAFLRGQGMSVIEHAFADHHYYNREDLHFNDDLPVIMTEKDAVKCQALPLPTEQYWYCLQKITLSEQFEQEILAEVQAIKQKY